MKSICSENEISVSSYVTDLAKKHGIKYEEASTDVVAKAITKLSGDEVITDETTELLVALVRANVIDKSTMLHLLGIHLMGQCLTLDEYSEGSRSSIIDPQELKLE